jgi:predicted dehydrogenase
MRLGIIGCGLIGQKRAAAATGHTLAWVCDRNWERAKKLAETTGAQCTDDWRQVVESAIDAVVVATTHDSLAEITLGAVAAGKHVLVEKPAGRSLQELLPIREALQSAGTCVKVGFNHRFHPGFLAARQLVKDGKLGPLYYVRGRYGHGGRPGYEKEWRSNRSLSGGGELIDQGSHLIDLSRWCLGELTLDYAALPTYFWRMDVEDNCFLALRGQHDRMAWLHATWTEWKNMFSFEVVGRDGKVVVEGLGGSYGTERMIHYAMRPEMGPPDTTTCEYPAPDQSWALEFKAFMAAIAGAPSEIADFADACAVHTLLERAYRGYQL